VDDAGDAARARRQRLGGQGEVRRLRRVGHARQGPRRRAHRRPRAPGSGQHGLSRREDDGRAPASRAGAGARRHRRAPRHARADERPRGQRTAASRSVPMAEEVGPPRFEMLGVRKTFGATVALDGVDLTVRGGEVCALVGQNGAGKSTLMAILAGALAPEAGTMRLDGVPYAPRDPLEARAAGVAMIYQELSLAPHLTVMENIVLGVEPVQRGIVQRDRMRRIATDALAQLGHDDIAPETLVRDLQPAAQQLVEIARALAVGCRVLVLDEPTSSLGHADVQALFALIGRLKARGIAIVYISHFIEEAKAISDRFAVLRDGRNAGGG